MISRYNYKELLWIDIEAPTHEEIRSIMEEFDIHPIVADELLSPSLRPKVDHYENLIYLILHFPAIRHTHQDRTQEIDFVIGKKFLITVHYESVDPLHKFSKVFEVNSILDKSNIGDHAGFLFFYMLKKIYAALFHEISAIADNLTRVEENIFDGKERKMVEELSVINRDILSMHRALKMHERVLESLSYVCTDFFGKDFQHYNENIIGEYHKVNELLNDQKDILDDLRTTNNSLLTTKTNETIKNLTIVSFTAFPASILTWIFSMGVNIPLAHNKHAFWIIIGMMVLSSGIAYIFARLKKWI
jgi:magnesium transporter